MYEKYEALSPEDKQKIEVLLTEIENHTPWKWEGSIWKTESSYYSYLRGSLRKIWSKWPFRNIYKKEHTYDAPLFDDSGSPILIKSGKNAGRQKTQKYFTCEVFNEEYPCSVKGKNNVEIDHIEPSGSLRSGLDACVFLFKLLCPQDNMRILCKEAHAIITHMERTGLSFEEAQVDKKVIEAMKAPVSKQIQILLENGFEEKDICNKDKRKNCFKKLFNKS